MKKKVIAVMAIIGMLMSFMSTIFTSKTYAAMEVPDTVKQASDWLWVYANSGAGLLDKTQWAKDNGFDIDSVDKKYVKTFDTTTVYSALKEKNIEISDTKCLGSWIKNQFGIISGKYKKEDALIIKCLSEIGFQDIDKVKLITYVKSDGASHVIDTSKNDSYAFNDYNEIIDGDILPEGYTITFESGVTDYESIKIEYSKQDGSVGLKVKKRGSNSEEYEGIDAIRNQIMGVDVNKIKVTDEKGNIVDLIKGSIVKKSISEIAISPIATEDKDGNNIPNEEREYMFFIRYGCDEKGTQVLATDSVKCTVVDKDNVTWYLVLGKDMAKYLVSEEAFKTPEPEVKDPESFETTLTYTAAINGKEVGGTLSEGTFLPNYDKDNIKADADVTATIKSKNGDNIASVNGNKIPEDGSKTADGWYYANTSDKTSISKVYPFKDYDNMEKNGIATEKGVKIANEAGLEDTQDVSIKWPFRIIDTNYNPEEIDTNTKEVVVTITTNLPMDPNKIPSGWTLVDNTGNHKIRKTYKRGDNVNELVKVYQNFTGDTDKTDVKIVWVHAKTGESTFFLIGALVCIVVAGSLYKKRKLN